MKKKPARKTPHLDPGHNPANELQRIPGIGPATAGDLIRLGITRLEQLKGKDPMQLYRSICKKDGARHDPCVIDVFIALVHHADTGESIPWFHFTAERKKRWGDGGIGPNGRRKT